jgi:hypothetical protein
MAANNSYRKANAWMLMLAALCSTCAAAAAATPAVPTCSWFAYDVSVPTAAILLT